MKHYTDEYIILHTQKLIDAVRNARYSTGIEDEAAQNALDSWMYSLSGRNLDLATLFFN